MKTIRKQYYGMKFPFTLNNGGGFCFDLNENPKDKVASQIAHVILTPKGTRIHMPEFGTNLIKWIFEPNDQETWDSVVEEVTNAVSRYVSATTLKNIEVVTPEDEDNSIYLDLRYDVEVDGVIENNRMAIKVV